MNKKQKIAKQSSAMILILIICISIFIALNATPVAAQKGKGGGGGGGGGTVTNPTPNRNITSYAYAESAPNPVGVNQKTLVFMWVDGPLPAASLTNDIRRHDYTLTITKPDSTTETQHWAVISDPTGVQFYSYNPTQVGTYTFKFDYGGQKYTWNDTSAMQAWETDNFLPASAISTLTVQEEPLPAAIDSYPLPTEYWSRPIEGQNTYWYTISSNWLRGAAIQDEPNGRYQMDGTAPNSAHIMWTKPIQMGGVVGGNSVGVSGQMFYSGENYDVRLQDEPIIIDGLVYYELPLGNKNNGGGYMCVDLRTGQQKWYQNIPGQTFGQILDYNDPNQHGANVGLLWAKSGTSYNITDAWTGTPLFTIANVSKGTMVYSPNGEILIYNIDTTTKTFACWNSTVVLGQTQKNSVDFDGSASYSWNITLSNLPTGDWSIERVFYNDVAVLTQGSFGTRSSSSEPIVSTGGANVTVISTKDTNKGTIIWTKHFDPPAGDIDREIGAIDPINRVLVFRDKETLNLWGYNLDNGNNIWGPTKISDSGFSYFHNSMYSYYGYGNLYTAGMDGVVRCFSIINGSLLWSYGNGGEGNSTYSGLQNPFGHNDINIGAIADGKIYTFVFEHTADSPISKNYQVGCLDAYTGKELWTIFSLITAGGGGARGALFPSLAIADGYFVYLNGYDMQFYCIGKGPSAMTVEAPKAAIKLGDSLVISGMVTDIAAGTQQSEQAARFPAGVPAVSDASMSAWMEYVYMQKPRPTNTIGVPVTINVVDSNGNFREIGTTTTNSYGFYSLNWKPDIEGQYTVYASFAGSDSYWSSNAVTAFAVDPAIPTPAPTNAPIQSTADMYFVPAVAGIVVLIIVCFAITALLMLRKRP